MITISPTVRNARDIAMHIIFSLTQPEPQSVHQPNASQCKKSHIRWSRFSFLRADDVAIFSLFMHCTGIKYSFYTRVSAKNGKLEAKLENDFNYCKAKMRKLKEIVNLFFFCIPLSLSSYAINCTHTRKLSSLSFWDCFYFLALIEN